LHHRTARDAAEVLGMSEHTVSRWLTGKRKPSYDALMKLAETYQVGIHLLDASRDKSPETWSQFLRELGDPERIERVETESIQPLAESGRRSISRWLRKYAALEESSGSRRGHRKRRGMACFRCFQAPPAGIEPATRGLGSRCSVH
jgi:transcriptional regulator with XRE-family HTH domain